MTEGRTPVPPCPHTWSLGRPQEEHKTVPQFPAILSPYLGLHSLSFSPLPGSRRGGGPEISCERLLHSTFLVAEEILYSGDFLLPATSRGTKGPKAEQVPEQGKELGLTCPGALGTGGGPSLARSN